MTLITTVPALQAHSALRYADWRGVVAEYVARRRGERPEDLVPRRSRSRRLAPRWPRSWPGPVMRAELEDPPIEAYASVASGFRE